MIPNTASERSVRSTRQRTVLSPSALVDMPFNSCGSRSARVVILPVPYDATEEWRTGSREGPQAILAASPYLELYDTELGVEIHELGIHTLPELEPVMGSPEAMLQRVYETTRRWLGRGKKVVMFGGEHALTIGAVRACHEKFPGLSVLHLDAHADLRDMYLGTPYSHACSMRRVRELCPVVSAGVRSLALEEAIYIRQQNIDPLYAREQPFTDEDLDHLLSSLSDSIYITIDMDVFDPSIMPAVGTPEPGGMEWHGVLRLLREAARRKNIVGFDLVELCPRDGPPACAYLAAKLAYKLIGYSHYLRHE